MSVFTKTSLAALEIERRASLDRERYPSRKLRVTATRDTGWRLNAIPNCSRTYAARSSPPFMAAFPSWVSPGDRARAVIAACSAAIA